MLDIYMRVKLSGSKLEDITKNKVVLDVNKRKSNWNIKSNSQKRKQLIKKVKKNICKNKRKQRVKMRRSRKKAKKKISRKRICKQSKKKKKKWNKVLKQIRMKKVTKTRDNLIVMTVVNQTGIIKMIRHNNKMGKNKRK